MSPSGTDGVIPRGLGIVGDLMASEDLTILGNFDGQITMPDHHLSIGEGASVKGKIVARAVTIGGTLDGSVLARERIEVTSTAAVRAHLTTAKILLADGAKFQGTIDPERTEAAMHVARFREKQAVGGRAVNGGQAMVPDLLNPTARAERVRPLRRSEPLTADRACARYSGSARPRSRPSPRTAPAARRRWWR